VGEGKGGNGREERASHTTAALGLAKPRAGSKSKAIDIMVAFYFLNQLTFELECCVRA